MAKIVGKKDMNLHPLASSSDGVNSQDSSSLSLIQGNPTLPSPKISPKRMSISLTGQAAEILDDLAKSQGITQNEALRKAIGTESYIRGEIASGSKLIVIKENGREVDVVFR